jgi:hypothetical protein
LQQVNHLSSWDDSLDKLHGCKLWISEYHTQLQTAGKEVSNLLEGIEESWQIAYPSVSAYDQAKAETVELLPQLKYIDEAMRDRFHVFYCLYNDDDTRVPSQFSQIIEKVFHMQKVYSKMESLSQEKMKLVSTIHNMKKQAFKACLGNNNDGKNFMMQRLVYRTSELISKDNDV